jgi:membrane protease YdiL (CAAX protease family)
MKVPMERCQRNLAILWFVGGGILLILLVIQTMGNHYLDKDNEAWGWLLPNLLPTLSLIIGVLMADTFGRGSKGKQVDTFVYRLALAVSVVYLLLVLLPILAQPVVSYAPLDLLKRSNLWLGPLQGLVSATIGAFFVKAEK